MIQSKHKHNIILV